MKITIPQWLCDPEFRFILITKKNKTPIEKEWQGKNNYPFDDPILEKHIADGGNYGVIGGFGNLVILDADSEEINEIAKTLPQTFTVKSGGELEHKHHYYYITKRKIKGHRLVKEKVGDIGDIRSIGQYVVGPNSIHPSGNEYRIVRHIPITKIDEHDLLAAFQGHLDKSEKAAKKTYAITTTKRKDDYTDYCRMPDYVLNNRLKNGCSKNWELFPIIVDILYNRGVSDSVFERIAEVQGHQPGAIKGWVEYAKKGSLRATDCQIMSEYIKKYIPELRAEICGQCELKKKDSNKEFFIVDSYIENVIEFYERQPFFYDKIGLFWFWSQSKNCYEIVDEIDLMNRLDQLLNLYGQTIQPKVKNNYIEAFKRVGRSKIPEEAPAWWVQFKDKVFDIKSGDIMNSGPDYFFSNPIPWEIGESSDTPVMDGLIEAWVGPQWKPTLYEIIAYCCYRDYPIHVIFALCGAGRNGKSKFQGLVSRFIGKDNLCSTELDLLTDNRFESFKLYKKLICSLGETNFNLMNKTSLLKKLCGQDLIGFEKKNKDPFDDYNYAKIVIASNSLPSTDDTSEGFYRRWIIINFPNTFPEGKDILETIPPNEYNNLAKKILDILPELIGRGSFCNQGTISERKDRYIMASNPLPFFLEKYCYQDTTGYVRYSELYTKYVGFLKHNNKRIVSKKEFTQILENEMYEIRKTTKEGQNDRWVLGLNLMADAPRNDKIEEIFPESDSCDTCAKISTQEKGYAELSENFSTSVTSVTKLETVLESIKIKVQEIGSAPLIEDVQKQFGFDIDPIIEQLKRTAHVFEPAPGRVMPL